MCYNLQIGTLHVNIENKNILLNTLYVDKYNLKHVRSLYTRELATSIRAFLSLLKWIFLLYCGEQVYRWGNPEFPPNKKMYYLKRGQVPVTPSHLSFMWSTPLDTPYNDLYVSYDIE